jgi:hypothetical protein
MKACRRDAEFLSRIVIERTPEIQEGTRKILIEFEVIFAEKLKAKSADIPPFDLGVDKTKTLIFPRIQSQI